MGRRLNTMLAALSVLCFCVPLQAQAAADIRAKESATSFGHVRPDGRSCDTAIDLDYVIAGENLILVTKEYATASIMMDTWMNSDSHRANILQSEFTSMAVGVYESEGTVFVSQIFLG